MHSSLYDYLGGLSAFGALVLCVAIYVLAVLVLYPMRRVFEGAAYNVARSSNVGDLFLVAVVLNAWGLLQSGIQPPAWATGWGWQLVCYTIGLGAALYFTFGQTPLWRTHLTDIYHNSVVMGVLTFAMFYIAPLILWSGKVDFIIYAFLSVSGWALLVVSDISTGRLQQRDWLKEHDPARYKLLRQG